MRQDWELREAEKARNEDTFAVDDEEYSADIHNYFRSTGSPNLSAQNKLTKADSDDMSNEKTAPVA